MNILSKKFYNDFNNLVNEDFSKSGKIKLVWKYLNLKYYNHIENYL